MDNRPPIRNKWAIQKPDLPLRSRIAKINQTDYQGFKLIFETFCFSVNFLQSSWQSKGSDPAKIEGCRGWELFPDYSDRLGNFRIYVKMRGEVSWTDTDRLEGTSKRLPEATPEIFVIAPGPFESEFFAKASGAVKRGGRYISRVATRGTIHTEMRRVDGLPSCEEAIQWMGP